MNRLSRNRGFTLVEILIVVVILGVLASIVLPQFSSAADDARSTSTSAELQTLRTQLELYKAHHNDTPPTLAQLWDNLLQRTNADGTLDSSGKYGPYLVKSPMNPYTRSTTVAVDGSVAATDGWVYDEATGLITAVGFDETTKKFTSP